MMRMAGEAVTIEPRSEPCDLAKGACWRLVGNERKGGGIEENQERARRFNRMSREEERKKRKKSGREVVQAEHR
jgi:hypothetical protein